MNNLVQEPPSSQFESATGNRFNLLTVVFVALIVAAGFGLFIRHYDENRLNVAVQKAEKFELAVSQIEGSRRELVEYLLSGDPSKAGQVSELQKEGMTALREIGESSQLPELHQRIDALMQEQQLWSKDFAEPLIEARKLLDSGHGTLVDLQINFLQRDPDRWSRNFERLRARVRELTFASGN
jgi:hypothetical protein